MVETYGFAGSQGRTCRRTTAGAAPPVRHRLCVHRPATTVHLLPMPGALADAGLHVPVRGQPLRQERQRAIMEKSPPDLGMYVGHARDTRRIARSCWSAGRAAARCRCSIRRRPSGPPSLTRRRAIRMISRRPASGGGWRHFHRGVSEPRRNPDRGLNLSLRDELRPDDRDLAFDIYDPGCPKQAAFSPDFVAAFRAAQRGRTAGSRIRRATRSTCSASATTARWSALSWSIAP